MSASSMTGAIHVEQNSPLPDFLQLAGDSQLKGWPVVGNVRSTLDAETAKAGWISFFMAGKIETTRFGIGRQKTLGAAFRRLARQVKSENCNSFEILHVTTRQFLGVSRITVAAHGRHLQELKEGLVCFGQ